MLSKLLRLSEGRMAKRLRGVADYVASLSDDIAELTDAGLKARTDEFRRRHADGETLEGLMPEAFAVAREAAWRVLELRPFDVQVMGVPTARPGSSRRRRRAQCDGYRGGQHGDPQPADRDGGQCVGLCWESTVLAARRRRCRISVVPMAAT